MPNGEADDFATTDSVHHGRDCNKRSTHWTLLGGCDDWNTAVNSSQHNLRHWVDVVIDSQREVDVQLPDQKERCERYCAIRFLVRTWIHLLPCRILGHFIHQNRQHFKSAHRNGVVRRIAILGTEVLCLSLP